MVGRRLLRCVQALLTLCLLQAAPAMGSVPLPDEVSPVMDQAGLLSAPAAVRLASRLEQMRAAAGQRVSVLTVESTGGAPIDAYVDHLLGYWEVDGGRDPGALLVVAWRERAIRLVATGDGRALDPARLQSIVHDVITPAFRRNAFDRGVEAGIDALSAEFEAHARRAAGLAEPARHQPAAAELRRERSGPDRFSVLMANLACILLAALLSVRALSGRSRAGSSGASALGRSPG